MRHVPIVAGGETRSLLSGSEAICQRSGACSEKIEAITLDEFFRKQGLDQVYHVLIDTEGHDALVLEGARGLLAKRKIALLEFEVNKEGFWSRKNRRDGRTVLGATARLAEAGYTCFWQTSAGLVPLSGACWRREMEMRRWSNIVCAHAEAEVALLATLAAEDEERRRGRPSVWATPPRRAP